MHGLFPYVQTGVRLHQFESISCCYTTYPTLLLVLFLCCRMTCVVCVMCLILKRLHAQHSSYIIKYSESLSW